MGRGKQGQEASTCKKLPWGGQGGVSQKTAQSQPRQPEVWRGSEGGYRLRTYWKRKLGVNGNFGSIYPSPEISQNKR